MSSCEFQELVSKGECAIKTNDTSTGIRLLEKALILGTDDQPMLAALHSQLGNAYFASRDYKQAKFYHMSDMNMSRQLKDRVQEAKASSNLSATCAMLFEFENAIDCAKKVVEIGRELGDEPLECRGHYNLGLAYLQCAIHKTNGASRHLKRENMMRALDAFQQHLSIAQKHQDRCFCGLSLGNIANTHYYLGDYQKSVDFHEKRLAIATQLDDKASIRRTLANIARAQTLLGEYESARDNYRAALNLAKEMGSPIEVLAQLRYDLNNVTSLIEQLDRQSNVSPRSCGPKIYCETGTNTSNSFGDSPRAYKSMNNLAIFEPPKQKKLSFDGGSMDKEAFFEMVSRMQGKRIDEQCAEFPLSDSQSVNNLDIANSSSSTTSRRGFTLSYKSTKNMVHNMKGGTMKSWTNLKGVFGSGSSSNNSRRRKQKQGTRTADFTEENARESPSPSCRDRDHSAGSSAKNSNVSRNTTK